MADNDRIARIRRRAYEIWEIEGRPDGLEHVHWLRAEAELGGDAGIPRATEKAAKRLMMPTPKPASSSKSSSKSMSKPTRKRPAKR